MYIGSSTNRNERFLSVIDGVDILVTGHTHRSVTFPTSKLVFDPQNNRVTQKNFYAVTCGSWLKYGGYALKKMLPPTAMANPYITLSAEGKKIAVTH
jgi:UDP-2,3-diacylglucosamine pyrophosphatase LpxH